MLELLSLTDSTGNVRLHYAASVWRKNKMGAWACRATPLNPPLQSAIQSVFAK